MEESEKKSIVMVKMLLRNAGYTYCWLRNSELVASPLNNTLYLDVDKSSAIRNEVFGTVGVQ